jgi:hypothetical protein
MPLDPGQALPYGFTETERCLGVARIEQIVSELPDDVALSKRKKFCRLMTWFPCPVFSGDAIRFHRQTIPERIVSLDRLTRIQTIE